MSVAITPAGSTDYKITDITLAAWSRRELTIAESGMPALTSPCRKYTSQQPLRGVKILDCTRMTI